jgi:hypothetical protein
MQKEQANDFPSSDLIRVDLDRTKVQVSDQEKLV